MTAHDEGASGKLRRDWRQRSGILDCIDRQFAQGSVTGAVDELDRNDGPVFEDIKLDAGVPGDLLARARNQSIPVRSNQWENIGIEILLKNGVRRFAGNIALNVSCGRFGRRTKN